MRSTVRAPRIWSGVRDRTTGKRYRIERAGDGRSVQSPIPSDMSPVPLPGSQIRSPFRLITARPQPKFPNTSRLESEARRAGQFGLPHSRPALQFIKNGANLQGTRRQRVSRIFSEGDGHGESSLYQVRAQEEIQLGHRSEVSPPEAIQRSGPMLGV